MKTMNILKGPQRGVSLYSYSGEFGRTMDLEDCFRDLQDMGATGVEILGNTHIEGYPEPDEAFLKKWFGLCKTYHVTPADYGHWLDHRLYAHRELTTAESLQMLEQDFKLASRLGFHVLRTKLGVVDFGLNPQKNWREIITEALPLAEHYDVVMCPEIHLTTVLADKMVEDYVEFIEATGTKYFGLNIDMSVFQNRFDVPGVLVWNPQQKHSKPEELIPLLPYVRCIHAKFNAMSDTFEELTIPYPEVLGILKDHGWNGYLISEYEGIHKDVPGYVSHELRKQHIMMKRILGY